jgi:hypothetical protein
MLGLDLRLVRSCCGGERKGNDQGCGKDRQVKPSAGDEGPAAARSVRADAACQSTSKGR